MKILLIDDETDLLDVMARGLIRKRLDVVKAIDKESALKAIAEHEDFAAIITDYNLEDTCGVDLAIAFNKKFPQTKLCLASGDTSFKNDVLDFLKD